MIGWQSLSDFLRCQRKFLSLDHTSPDPIFILTHLSGHILRIPFGNWTAHRLRCFGRYAEGLEEWRLQMMELRIIMCQTGNVSVILSRLVAFSLELPAILETNSTRE